MKSNRFKLASELNYLDTLSWLVTRPDGALWKCTWRNRSKLYHDDLQMTFMAFELTEDDDYNQKSEAKIALILEYDSNGNLIKSRRMIRVKRK